MRTEKVEWEVQWSSKTVTSGRWCRHSTASTKKEAKIELKRLKRTKHFETRLIKRTIIEEVVE